MLDKIRTITKIENFKPDKITAAYGALCYIFPMQFFVLAIVLKYSNHKEYLKKHIFLGNLMQIFILALDLIAFLFSKITLTGIIKYITGGTALLIVIFNFIFFIYLFIRIILIANGKRI